MSKKTHAIGMFDSGVGGLTVMQQMARTLPQESIFYLGDTARLPYGDKSRETIVRYSVENAIFLLEKQIKILVVACNTASAYSLERLNQIFNIPVIGVIEPGADRVASVTKNGRVAVLGTRGTIQSGIYQQEILKRLPQATIIPIACPLFVPLVEERHWEHEATRLIIRDYLAPLKNQGVDTLLLGCTHYPLLRTLIQEEVGPDVMIVDSASSCAERVAEILNQNKLLTPLSSPCYRYFVSDDPEKFRSLGKAFLGNDIACVETAKL